MAAVPTLKSNVKYDIENVVEKTFLKYQEKYSIESGDCEPLMALELDEKIESLAETVRKILESQMPDPVLCGFVWSHGEDDISAWCVDLEKEDRDAIEKILMKYECSGYSLRNCYDLPFNEVF